MGDDGVYQTGSGVANATQFYSHNTVGLNPRLPSGVANATEEAAVIPDLPA